MSATAPTTSWTSRALNVLIRWLYAAVIIVAFVGFARVFAFAFSSATALRFTDALEMVWRVSFFVVIPVCLISWRIRSRLHAGTLLFNCGRTSKDSLSLIFGGICLVWSVYSSIEFFTNHAAGLDIKNILHLLFVDSANTRSELFFFLLAILFFNTHFDRLLICQNGVWSHDFFRKWNKIESYRWGGETDFILELQTKSKLSFLQPPANFIIRYRHKDAVDELLRSRLAVESR
jgi:hypothetical protein